MGEGSNTPSTLHCPECGSANIYIRGPGTFVACTECHHVAPDTRATSPADPRDGNRPWPTYDELARAYDALGAELAKANHRVAELLEAVAVATAVVPQLRADLEETKKRACPVCIECSKCKREFEALRAERDELAKNLGAALTGDSQFHAMLRDEEVRKLRAENEKLKEWKQLHVGETASLSGDLDREKSLREEVEVENEKLKAEAVINERHIAALEKNESETWIPAADARDRLEAEIEKLRADVARFDAAYLDQVEKRRAIEAKLAKVVEALYNARSTLCAAYGLLSHEVVEIDAALAATRSGEVGKCRNCGDTNMVNVCARCSGEDEEKL